MINIDQEKELFAKAYKLYGRNYHLNLLMEECGELVAAINRHKRKRIFRLQMVSEIVDVLIMIEQVLHNEDMEICDLKFLRNDKMVKLINKLNKDGKGN